jgi:cell division transport system permease protein
MLLDFALPEHDRKLIPEGRLSGPMPWVIAIMLFLTLLVAAAGLTLAEAARQGGQDLARHVTVQIIEADPAQRATQRAAVTRTLRKLDSIAEVKPVPDAQVRALLEPWLGTGVIDADVPVPALVDVRFASVPTAETLTRLQSTLRSVAPNIRVDSHSSWMAPFFDLMRALLWLAAAMFLLLLVATSAVVILAVRSTLNTHRETIEIMHMMGGIVGFIVAAVVIMTVGGRFAAVEPGLLSDAHFPYYGWAILAFIPLAVMALAMLMARMTVISALKRIL